MRVRALIYPAAGCALLLCAWELSGRHGALGRTFPSLTQVARVLDDQPRRALLLRSSVATLGSACAGFLLGTCLGAVTAVVAHLAPLLRPGLDRLSVLVAALPVIALAPVLIITAGRENTPAALACIPVFFLVYTSTGVGLRSASQRLQLVMTTLGATRWRRLLSIEAIAALPSVLSGLKIATTSAMIGSIVGEWFGAPTGLGVVVLNSMQNFQIPLLWATVIIIAALTLSGYGLLTLAERSVARRING